MELEAPRRHLTHGIDHDLAVFLAEVEHHEVITVYVDGVAVLDLICPNHIYKDRPFPA